MLAIEQSDDVGFPYEEQGEQLKDLRLEMRVKNNVLWNAIHDHFPSVATFCAAHEALKGVTMYHKVLRLMGLKISPFKKKKEKEVTYYTREYREVCLLLEKALRLPAEQLFPKELYEKFVGVATSKAFEISSFTDLPSLERQKILMLPAPEEDVIEKMNLSELKDRIDKLLCTLTYREQEVIKLRYGIPDGTTRTYDELAEIFKVSCSRIGQIEARALRKLMHPFRSDSLRSFL